MLYRASLGSKSCDVHSSGSPPFACTIDGLSGGAPQTVQAVACLTIGDCSNATTGQGFTLPDGTMNLRAGS